MESVPIGGEGAGGGGIQTLLHTTQRVVTGEGRKEGGGENDGGQRRSESTVSGDDYNT